MTIRPLFFILAGVGLFGCCAAGPAPPSGLGDGPAPKSADLATNRIAVVPNSTVDPGVYLDPAYEKYKSELCSWSALNRADPATHFKFVERSSALVQGRNFEFAVAALQDRAMAMCWQRVAETIGHAGSEEQVRFLLDFFETVQVGRWPPQSDFYKLYRMASARKSLGFAALRFPSSRLSTSIVDHLQRCSRPEFWAGARSPARPAGSLRNRSAEEAQQDSAESQHIRCIRALGVTGSDTGKAALKQLKGESFIQAEASLEFRVEQALKLASQLQKLGLQKYVEEAGSP